MPLSWILLYAVAPEALSFHMFMYDNMNMNFVGGVSSCLLDNYQVSSLPYDCVGHRLSCVGEAKSCRAPVALMTGVGYPGYRP